ncbi:Acetyltransferase (GNAT) family protein [Glycomyces sambucus]|uniref:Acetyltransferase (GNAT) family protein n=2 Tax=Glycomyces sambucus TaxID=380244 RepID=A0A1G9IA44_9ACTN|nr:Acetyltransferase (GNAT) family protein [Glycomyces sambucus]
MERMISRQAASADRSRFERVATAFWMLGAESTVHAGFEVVRHAAAPDHPLGTFVHRVRDAAAMAVIAAGEDAVVPGRLLVDADTPGEVEAVAALHDWTVEHLLLLELPKSTVVPEPEGLEVRVAEGDDDWREIERLFRIDHLEEDSRHGTAPRPEAQTRAAVDLRRSLGPQVQYLLAERGGAVIGSIAAWPGIEGIGVIEDVFVHPGQRGAGIATQMLRHAVQRARAGGARSILIGAEVEDTPKHLSLPRLRFPTGLAAA